MIHRTLNDSQWLKILPTLVSCALILFCSQPVFAHPHSWIEMKTHIEGHDGMITGFQMEWSFDAMTSAFMFEDKDHSPGQLQKALDDLTVSVMKNIKKEHYFTHFYDGSNSLDFKPAINGRFSRNRARLVLTFDLPLLNPQALTKESLKLLIYEPSYYVDMNWPATSSITLSEELSGRCKTELIEPNPTAQQMRYAFTLPANATPDNSLGELFTQHIRLYCSTEPDEAVKK